MITVTTTSGEHAEMILELSGTDIIVWRVAKHMIPMYLNCKDAKTAERIYRLLKNNVIIERY